MLVLDHSGVRTELHASGADGNYQLRGDALALQVSGARWHDGALSARFDGAALRLRARVAKSYVFLHDGERRLRFEQMPAFHFEGTSNTDSGNRLLAPMPGRVVLLQTEVGIAVAEGQALMVMEAMKMELTLRAPRAGKVTEIRASVGEFVEADAVLLLLEEET
jgi:3-methylcrotonyl-CoA carboxylase alpha subunit